MKITPEIPDVEATAGKKIAVAVGHNRFTGSTGTDFLSVAFVVLHSKDEDKGAIHVERFPLIEKAAWRLAQWAGATGYLKDFDVSVDDDVEKIMSVGPLIIDLVEDNYNNRTRLQVKKFTPYRGPSQNEWEQIGAAGENKWASILEGMQSRLTAGSASGNRSTNVTTTADDIPF